MSHIYFTDVIIILLLCNMIGKSLKMKDDWMITIFVLFSLNFSKFSINLATHIALVLAFIFKSKYITDI